jgi:hypothetical protein
MVWNWLSIHSGADLRFYGGDSDYRFNGKWFTTNERGLYNDPIWAFIGNNEGTGFYNNTTVFGVYDNSIYDSTPLLKVDEDGIVTAKSGLATSVADGFRRVNVCNTGAIGTVQFTPAIGDITCTIVDNVATAYIYDNNTWTELSKGVATGGGVTKMQVTDDFNRADGGLGASWATLDNVYAPQIDTNEVKINASGNSIAFYSDNTFASNQYAQVKLSSAVTADANGGPVVRAQNSSGGKAYVAFVTSATELRIYLVDTADWTQLGASCTGTFAENDIIRLEASGSTLTAKVNGAPVTDCSRTDATLTGGRPGVYVDGPDFRIDDFTGGDL